MDAETCSSARRRPAALATIAAVATLCLGAASLPGPALAQSPVSAAAVPDAREMIDALRPARQRNLTLRQTAPATAAAPSSAAPAATPAMQAAPAMNAAPATEPGPPPSLSLAIQFDINSSRVQPESGRLLGNLVAAMLSPELKSSRFLIEGHTDASGAAASNQRLSQERADEVRLYLVALGVPPSRLRAVGKGSSEPVDALDPLSAQNRRVRVVTLE